MHDYNFFSNVVLLVLGHSPVIRTGQLLLTVTSIGRKELVVSAAIDSVGSMKAIQFFQDGVFTLVYRKQAIMYLLGFQAALKKTRLKCFQHATTERLITTGLYTFLNNPVFKASTKLPHHVGVVTWSTETAYAHINRFLSYFEENTQLVDINLVTKCYVPSVIASQLQLLFIHDRSTTTATATTTGYNQEFISNGDGENNFDNSSLIDDNFNSFDIYPQVISVNQSPLYSILYNIFYNCVFILHKRDAPR